MKILSSHQIKAADAFTIKNEPIVSIDLMERAAHKMVETFVNDYQSTSWNKHIFCGPGNNGGDGLAIARLLSAEGHKCVVYHLPGNVSENFKINLNRLIDLGTVPIIAIDSCNELPIFQPNDVIIDALFGTGLRESVSGLTDELIRYLNDAQGIKISIDIPSGLFADKHSTGTIFKADRVYTFQCPKLAFLLPENGEFVKRFKTLDIKLSPEFLQDVPSNNFFLEKKDIQPLYLPRKKFSHKGTFGHLLLIAGSYGKMGAACLSAAAALRSGVGLVTVHTAACGYNILQNSVPEAMCEIDKHEHFWTDKIVPKGYDVLGIGPGIGTNSYTIKAFKKTLEKSKLPLVIDADGINILAKEPSLWKHIPEESILTPHPGEFRRLAGEWSNDFERLELQRNVSKLRKVIIILKGAHTSISDTQGNISFNSTGNSGMSTGGSGDVLTGIVSGLLAQGYAPINAALLGTYLHGLSGNFALDQQSKESLIASDIIENLGKAFKFIRQ